MKRSAVVLSVLSMIFGTSILEPLRAEPRMLPNLRATSPSEIRTGSSDNFLYDQGNDVIRFGVHIQNLGGYPLELVGLPTPRVEVESQNRTRQKVLAQQCTAWMDHVCTRYEHIGLFDVPLDNSRAWMMPDLYVFELRSLVSGVPDMSPGGLVTRGNRKIVCIFDEGRVPGFPDPDSLRAYEHCNSYRMGLSRGWHFIRHWHTFDQYVPLSMEDGSPVPDGTYAIVFRFDAGNVILESDESDNVASSLVEVFDNATRVRPIIE